MYTLRTMNAAVMAVQLVTGLVAAVVTDSAIAGLFVAIVAPWVLMVFGSMFTDINPWQGPVVTATCGLASLFMPLAGMENGELAIPVAAGLACMMAWVGMSAMMAEEEARRSGGTTREHFPEAIPWLCIIAWVAAWARGRKSPALLAL